METFLILLMWVAAAGVVAVALRFAEKMDRLAKINLTRLASQYGLPAPGGKTGAESGSNSVSTLGTVRGRQLRMYELTKGFGKSTKLTCHLTISVENHHRLNLAIPKENLRTRAKRSMGIDDISTGDEHFDNEFHVRSNNPDLARAALPPEVRAQFVQAFQRGADGVMKVQGGHVTYEEETSFRWQETCALWPRIVDLGFALAEAVDGGTH